MTETEEAPAPPGSTAIRSLEGDLDKMAADMCAIQRAIKPVRADSKAEVRGESKKSGKAYTMTYAYAGLPSVMEAILPAVHEQGVALLQLPVADGKSAGCTTILVGDGWRIAFNLRFPVTSVSPQVAGSNVSYARRYSLLALFGLAPEEDDGRGDKAEDHARRQRQENERPNRDIEKVDPKLAIAAFAKYGIAEEVLLAELGGTPIAKVNAEQTRHMRGLIQALKAGDSPSTVLSDAALEVMYPKVKSNEPDEAPETTEADEKPF